MRTLLIAAAACLALGACAGQPVVITPPTVTTAGAATTAAPQTDPLTQLANFTVADLQAASADAHAQNPPDQTAFMCYDFLAATIPTIKLPGGQQGTVGAFVGFQKLRDLHNGTVSQSGLLKSLNLACAPLVIDTQTVINKLLIMGAGAGASGGLLGPAAGAIGGIVTSIPLP